jgi:predicted kinase/CRISPR/Cas system-associated endonuclease Cas3-HD
VDYAKQVIAFSEFYVKFRQTNLWAEMAATVENSPWHREENVAVHTEMIVNHYLGNFAKHRTPKERTLALLAILFHDTGKPDAEQEKTSEERGTYRIYAGHEKLSARTWVDFAMEHKEWLEPLDVQLTDVSNIAFLIEHHLPYGLKKKEKLVALKTALVQRFGDYRCAVFYDLLRSDAAGRISDGHAEKLANVEAWIGEFDKVQAIDIKEPKTPLRAYILSGVSGAGKSTFMRTIHNPVVFSLDDCRLDFYDRITDDPKKAYADAWAYANANEKLFAEYVQKRWKDALFEAARSHNALVIDNTNLSRKSRARWVSELMTSKSHHFGGGENGWAVIGVSVYTPLKTVLRRRLARHDKTVPLDTVTDMYFRAEEFMLGTECHAMLMIDGEE